METIPGRLELADLSTPFSSLARTTARRLACGGVMASRGICQFGAGKSDGAEVEEEAEAVEEGEEEAEHGYAFNHSKINPMIQLLFLLVCAESCPFRLAAHWEWAGSLSALEEIPTLRCHLPISHAARRTHTLLPGALCPDLLL